MKFDNLEDRMLYFRELSNYKLIPNSYVLVMVDGRSFSSNIKKYFQKPFDETFINIMNEAAIYAAKNIQGCKFAYVQSDEISFVITDFDTPTSDAFFSYRINKILPIVASFVSSKFNQLMIKEAINRKSQGENIDLSEIYNIIDNTKLYEFDCKCWNVPTYNDVIGWLLYRQTDCIKNSKQQAARSFLPHKLLLKKTADEQLELLKLKKNIDWYIDYNDGEKFGRFIYKDTIQYNSPEYGEYERHMWMIHNGKDLKIPENREFILQFIPKID